MATADALMGNKLFREISTLNLERLLLMAKEVSFPAGERIFHEGEKAQFLYVIQEGVLDLTFHLKMGGVESDLTIDKKGKGESVGWSALVSPHLYTLSGVCRKPLKALIFDGESLLELCREDPTFGFVLMRNVAELVGTRMKQLETMFIQEIQRGIKTM
jgi:CRP-like cAMP-binding protein